MTDLDQLIAKCEAWKRLIEPDSDNAWLSFVNLALEVAHDLAGRLEHLLNELEEESMAKQALADENRRLREAYFDAVELISPEQWHQISDRYGLEYEHRIILATDTES